MDGDESAEGSEKLRGRQRLYLHGINLDRLTAFRRDRPTVAADRESECLKLFCITPPPRVLPPLR